MKKYIMNHNGIHSKYNYSAGTNSMIGGFLNEITAICGGKTSIDREKQR